MDNLGLWPASQYNHDMAVVSINPNVLGGTLVFSGTRVPVAALFDALKRGRSIDDFIAHFPTVHRDQIEALLDRAKTDVTVGRVTA